MRYLRIVILFLIICNIPGFALVNFNAEAGTILSYLTFILILLYHIFNDKEKFLYKFIVLGLLYFLISFIVDSQNADNLVVTAVKYFIFIIAGASVIQDTKVVEIYSLLLLGSLSIIYESIYIVDIGGRFSGFYLNPNSAGFISILGYCFSISIDNKKLRLFGQFLFSIAGFVTFSRTFLLLWVIVNIVSLFISLKNITKIIVGVVLFSFMISFGDKFDFNTRRLDAFSGILEGKISDDLEEDSRTDTWSLYYNKILERPVFGNGYLSFSGKSYGTGESAYTIVGVHNTFLMIMGESGFLVFFVFIWIYASFMVNGFKLFGEDPLIFLISFILSMFMLSSHNYFDSYTILFFSIWLCLQIDKFQSNANTSLTD